MIRLAVFRGFSFVVLKVRVRGLAVVLETKGKLRNGSTKRRDLVLESL